MSNKHLKTEHIYTNVGSDGKHYSVWTEHSQGLMVVINRNDGSWMRTNLPWSVVRAALKRKDKK